MYTQFIVTVFSNTYLRNFFVLMITKRIDSTKQTHTWSVVQSAKRR